MTTATSWPETGWWTASMTHIHRERWRGHRAGIKRRPKPIHHRDTATWSSSTRRPARPSSPTKAAGQGRQGRRKNQTTGRGNPPAPRKLTSRSLAPASCCNQRTRPGQVTPRCRWAFAQLPSTTVALPDIHWFRRLERCEISFAHEVKTLHATLAPGTDEICKT